MQSHQKVTNYQSNEIQKPSITIFEQSTNLNQQNDEQENLSDSEPEISSQDAQNQNLLLSKYQHYNTIVEDENEEGFYEESNKETNQSKPFLMSINFQNISLYRFPTLDQEKTIRAEINNIEIINNIVYYVIETKSSQLGYAVKVKRRYNDFKFLLKELTMRYPWLILPYLPVGIGVGKLNSKDVEERKRLLQNVINIVTMHQELIQSNSIRNFYEETDMTEFDNKRKQSYSNQKGGLAQNLQNVLDKSYRSFGQMKSWWNGTTQNNKYQELELIRKELIQLQAYREKTQKLLHHIEHIQRKQQKLKDLLALQDSQKDGLLLETKLHDCVFDYAQQLNFQTNTLEDKFDQYYQQQIWQLKSLIEFIDYTDIYFKQLNNCIDDFNEQLEQVSPFQQTQNRYITRQQTIKDEIKKYLTKAYEQIINKDGIVQKYIWSQQKSFSDYYLNQQQEIWSYAKD